MVIDPQIRYLESIVISQLEKAVGDRNLRQVLATPPALNASRAIIDHVTIRFALYISYWWSIGTEPLCLDASFEIFDLTHNEHRRSQTNMTYHNISWRL